MTDDLMHEFTVASTRGDMTIYRCKHCGRGVATKGTPANAPCRKRPHPDAPKKKTYGAGTELKRLLSRIGITSTPTCSCNRKAREMDARGIQWCRDNVDLIAGEWLLGEAKKRGLPYSTFAGKKLVQLAIMLAERNAPVPETVGN